MPSPKKCASKFKKGSKGYNDCISYQKNLNAVLIVK